MWQVGWIMLVMSCASRTPKFAVQALGQGPFTFGPCPEALLRAAETECALVQAPLDGSAPSGRTITLFVRRIPAVPGSVSADQVWALDGGPGFAGDVFTDPDFYRGARDAGYDVIIPTHRGSVYGTGLSCPAQQAPDSPGGGQVVAEEYPACVEALQAEWGDDLARFSAVDAARDVLYLMRRMKTEGRAIVFGGSYGSVWGQRLLQLDPPIAGMWLDSIVDLEEGLDQADENAHDAGMALLGRCADAPACAERFPDGPIATAEDLIATMPEPICGLQPATVRRLLNRLLSSHPAEQALVAPTVLRLHRCDEDEAALVRAVKRMEQSANVNPPLAYNPLLNRLIIHREIYRYDREPSGRTLLFGTDANAPFAQELAAFPPALVAPRMLDVPQTDAHLVLWQGGLDPLDPLAWAHRTVERWSENQVTLIEVPDAGHSVVRYAVTADGRRCAVEMLAAFLDDPSAPLSRECVEQVPKIDYAAETEAVREASEQWFGVADPWGGAPARP